eukprot:1094943-Amphidinium_carterae.1
MVEGLDRAIENGEIRKAILFQEEGDTPDDDFRVEGFFPKARVVVGKHGKELIEFCSARDEKTVERVDKQIATKDPQVQKFGLHLPRKEALSLSDYQKIKEFLSGYEHQIEGYVQEADFVESSEVADEVKIGKKNKIFLMALTSAFWQFHQHISE